MRIVLLYKTNSGHAGVVEDYAREYRARHPNSQLELLDVESQQGQELARLHDINNFPAILALGDDGRFLQLWQDEHQPLMNELDFYQQA